MYPKWVVYFKKEVGFMLRHTNLYDPIKRPEVAKEIEFSRYVEIHKNQTAPTGAGYVKGIKDQFYKANSKAKPENLDKVWEFVAPKVEKNAGLAEFISDYHGAESKFFFPWLINVFNSPSTALEISYGAGPDVDGNWHEDILDTDDPFVPFIYDDPAFVYNRERQLFVADLVSTIYDFYRIMGTTAIKYKIVDFGAGRMAWARRHGCGLAPWVDIYAFDKDTSIDPDELFASEAIKNIHYPLRFVHEDFTSHLTDPNCCDADLIILGGVASYIPPEAFFGKIVPAIYMLLKPGGVFFFDLQTSTPCYRHSMDILDWKGFMLPETPAIVIDSVEKARLGLWEKGLRFSAEYAVDTYNKIPSGVMMTFQKV